MDDSSMTSITPFLLHSHFFGLSKKCVTSYPISSPDLILSPSESNHFVQSCLTSVVLCGPEGELDLAKGLWFNGMKVIPKTRLIDYSSRLTTFIVNLKLFLSKKVSSNLSNCASLMFLWKTSFGRYCV